MTVPIIVLAQTDEIIPTPIEPTLAEDLLTGSTPRYHIVEAGQSLFYIADLYGINSDSIQIANGITDPSLLFVGQELFIPSFEEQIFRTIYTVKLGETPNLVAEKFGVSSQEIILENYLISPDSLISGLRLKVFSRTGSENPNDIRARPHIVQAGETIAHIASRYGVTVSSIIVANNLSQSTLIYPGQRLRIPSVIGSSDYVDLPNPWKEIRIDSSPIRQGDAVSLYVEYLEEGVPRGQVVSRASEIIPLHFIPTGNGFTALIGFDAFADPGVWELVIEGESSKESWVPFTAHFFVEDSGFGTQYITLPSEFDALLAPEVRANEDAFLDTFFTNSNPEPFWTGTFQMPISSTITAEYGDARSYNDGPITVFHSGIDFQGTVDTPIYSPAEGKVIFVGPLVLRGNSIILDHGMGVTTAYYHLSSFDVSLDEVVEQGQKIANGGNTGLSTGPHLHWDLRVWGKAVHPSRWLKKSFSFPKTR